MEWLQGKIIPDHEISYDEEHLTWDQLTSRLSHDNHVPHNVSLHLKLSGPRVAREPFALQRGRRFSFALILNELRRPAYRLPEELPAQPGPDDDVPADVEEERPNRVADKATVTIDKDVDLGEYTPVSALEREIQKYIAGYITEIKDRGGERTVWKKEGDEYSMEDRLGELGMTPNSGVVISLNLTDALIELEKKLQRVDEAKNFLEGKFSEILPYIRTFQKIVSDSQLKTPTKSGEQLGTSEIDELKRSKEEGHVKLKEIEEENMHLREKLAKMEDENKRLREMRSPVSFSPLATADQPSVSPTTTSEQWDIFLSYEWGSQKIVKALYDNLHKEGYRCWIDIYNMHGGDSLYEELVRGIKCSKVFVACITRKYLQSRNCGFEVECAVQSKPKLKPVIPLLLEEMEWPVIGGIGYLLSGLPYVDMTESHDQIMEWKGNKVDELSRLVSNYLRDEGQMGASSRF